jgi:hypothetical protein
MDLTDGERVFSETGLSLVPAAYRERATIYIEDVFRYLNIVHSQDNYYAFVVRELSLYIESREQESLWSREEEPESESFFDTTHTIIREDADVFDRENRIT